MTSGRWADSTRSTRLPSDWAQRCQHVKARDRGRCRHCGTTTAHLVGQRWQGGQVDHVHHGDNHHLDNLQLLCRPCHTAKTQQEANASRQANPRHRPPEPHPGTPQQAPQGWGVTP